jgi:hypothetical protein
MFNAFTAGCFTPMLCASFHYSFSRYYFIPTSANHAPPKQPHARSKRSGGRYEYPKSFASLSLENLILSFHFDGWSATASMRFVAEIVDTKLTEIAHAC